MVILLFLKTCLGTLRLLPVFSIVNNTPLNTLIIFFGQIPKREVGGYKTFRGSSKSIIRLLFGKDGGLYTTDTRTPLPVLNIIMKKKLKIGYKMVCLNFPLHSFDIKIWVYIIWIISENSFAVLLEFWANAVTLQWMISARGIRPLPF